MGIFQNISLKFKIAVVLTIIFSIAFIVVLVFVFPGITGKVIEYQEEQQIEMARQVKESVSIHYTMAGKELESLARMKDMSTLDKKKLDKILSIADNTSQFFNYFFVMDSSGKWISYPTRNDLVNGQIPAGNMEWVSETFRSGRTIYMDVFVSRRNTLVSGFSTPITDSTGKPKALLRGVFEISENNLALALIKNIKIGKNGFVYIVSSNGYVIAHPGIALNPAQIDVLDFSGYDPVREVIQGHTGIREYEYSGQTWVAAYTPVEVTGWGVIAQQPKENMIMSAQMKSKLIWPVFLLFLLMGIMFTGIVVYFTLRPLVDLVNKLENNEFSKNHKPWNKDEIGRIGRKFEELFSNMVLSRDNLSITINAIGDGVIATNEKGIIQLMNPVAERLTGWTSSEASGSELTSVFNIINTRTSEPAVNPVEKVLTTGEIVEISSHTILVGKEGNRYRIADSAAPIYNGEHLITGVVLVFRDITEMYSIQQKLKQEQTRLELIISGSNQGTWDWNLKTNRVQYNECFATMLGYSSDEIPPNPESWSKLFHCDDIPEILKEIKSHIKGKSPLYESESRLLTKDGTWKWVLIRGRIVAWDEDGKPFRAAGTQLDITDRKNAENKVSNLNKELLQSLKKIQQINIELEAAKNKAEESDRLKTAFLANLSHEIRTPMNGILGFAELLKSENNTAASQKEYINIIEQSGQRMLRLIGDLVDISKIEAGLVEINNEATELHQLLQKLHNFFKPAAEHKSIQLQYIKNADKNLIINLDSIKLEQILTNLINNALKFTQAGSIQFGYEIIGGSLQFWVKDTGRGIPAELHEVIFERFRQADNTYLRGEEGSGLGLAICRAYVELMGGRIWVESEPAKGSEFRFDLPFSEVRPKKDMKDHAKDASHNLKDVSLMIAEDDETSFSFLYELLKSSKAKIIRASNGKEALQMLEENPGIQLILMDLKMPVMDGIEATCEIRKHNLLIPIIAQTAYASDPDKQRAIAAGCNDFITKPINRDLLFVKLGQYIVV
jgi:PAS domain S-box-containing protein